MSKCQKVSPGWSSHRPSPTSSPCPNLPTLPTHPHPRTGKTQTYQVWAVQGLTPAQLSKHVSVCWLRRRCKCTLWQFVTLLGWHKGLALVHAQLWITLCNLLICLQSLEHIGTNTFFIKKIMYVCMPTFSVQRQPSSECLFPFSAHLPHARQKGTAISFYTLW